MEIRLEGGPYDKAVFATGRGDTTFTMMGVTYVETQKIDEVGRRIFEYKGVVAEKHVNTVVAVQGNVGQTQAGG